MNWIPGWQSIEGAEWWSGTWFWISIACLIGLGISEVISHRYSGRKDELEAQRQLETQQQHDTDIAALQLQTSKANEGMALAGQHAAEANSKAEAFRLDIAKANERAAEAQAQVADAHNEAARANQIAESERLARLQLEARLADRVITVDQQRRLTQAFSPLKGQTVDVVIMGDSLEITNTANAITGSINAAGVFMNFIHPMAAAYARGIIIGARKDASDADKKTCNLFVLILRETIGDGVGQDDFERIAVQMTGTAGSTPGAGPMGQSSIRLIIAPK